jgi:hypothetical protein
MSNTKNLLVFLILYFSLLLGFLLDENLNFGSYYDWINVYVPPTRDFSNNFYETLIGFEKYGQRHSPFYIIFLSFLLRLGLDLDTVRFMHMNGCIIFIFLFYHCLKLRFKDIDKFTLQLLSMFIFLSPTFRSLSIWPDSRLPGLIIFVLSIYFFLKFMKNNDDKKVFFAFYSALSLILSSYISPNFSLFAIFFYLFFFKYLSYRSFILLFLLSAILSIPMLYYIFILDVNFMTAGRTPGIEQTSIAFSFNISNKILIISSILFFHLIPAIYFLTDSKQFLLFLKKKMINFIIFFAVFIYFFNYQISFTGGGFFYQLSIYMFDNNIFFYCISFYTLFYIYYISSLSRTNLILLGILIFSNIQNTIYHKYYEPLILIIVLVLFENLNFKKFLSSKINIIYLYMAGLFYIFIRVIKILYLV